MSSSIFSSEFIWDLLPPGLQAALRSYSYLGTLNLDLVLLAALITVGLLVVLVVLRRVRSQSRVVPYAVVGVLLVRSLLYWNPAAWYTYQSLLPAEEVGFRQASVITMKLREYFVPPPELRYLAIGSSQTGSVYGEYAKRHQELYHIQLAGFGPVEYFLYRSLISRFEPEYVLLYLSEFDLARPPAYSTFRYAPRPGFDFLAYRRAVLDRDSSPEAKRAFTELVAANLFPEYRFAFVHDGLLDKWLDRRRAFTGEVGGEGPVARPEPGMELSPNAVPLSLTALEWFVDWCRRRGTKVVIVEGQYAPSAMSSANRALHDRVDPALRALADPDGGIYFLPRDVFRPLTDSDFDDAAHVKDAVGYEIAAAVVARIRSITAGRP